MDKGRKIPNASRQTHMAKRKAHKQLERQTSRHPSSCDCMRLLQLVIALYLYENICDIQTDRETSR